MNRGNAFNDTVATRTFEVKTHFANGADVIVPEINNRCLVSGFGEQPCINRPHRACPDNGDPRHIHIFRARYCHLLSPLTHHEKTLQQKMEI